MTCSRCPARTPRDPLSRRTPFGNSSRRNSFLVELPLGIALEEIASRVFEDAWLDDDHAVNICLDYFHSAFNIPGSFSMCPLSRPGWRANTCRSRSSTSAAPPHEAFPPLSIPCGRRCPPGKPPSNPAASPIPL